MSLTTNLIDRLTKAKDLKNDCQVANYLKVKPATIYRYRDGHTMDYSIALLVCDELDIDPAPVMAELAADREVNKKTKAVFKTIAKRLSTTAATLLVGLVTVSNSTMVLVDCILC